MDNPLDELFRKNLSSYQGATNPELDQIMLNKLVKPRNKTIRNTACLLGVLLCFVTIPVGHSIFTNEVSPSSQNNDLDNQSVGSQTRPSTSPQEQLPLTGEVTVRPHLNDTKKASIISGLTSQSKIPVTDRAFPELWSGRSGDTPDRLPPASLATLPLSISLGEISVNYIDATEEENPVIEHKPLEWYTKLGILHSYHHFFPNNQDDIFISQFDQITGIDANRLSAEIEVGVILRTKSRFHPMAGVTYRYYHSSVSYTEWWVAGYEQKRINTDLNSIIYEFTPSIEPGDTHLSTVRMHHFGLLLGTSYRLNPRRQIIPYLKPQYVQMRAASGIGHTYQLTLGIGYQSHLLLGKRRLMVEPRVETDVREMQLDNQPYSSRQWRVGVFIQLP
ncbi:MAG: autotransporter outer membrane beta-barrel domain-containing protein [Cyclobacteriaceae bacterium]